MTDQVTVPDAIAELLLLPASAQPTASAALQMIIDNLQIGHLQAYRENNVLRFKVTPAGAQFIRETLGIME
jgi:hypothetical protein